MKAWKVVACLGAGALCVVTGGLAAPAIGAAVGSTFMGLSGAAATSAGLAAIGGGSLAVGGLGMAGGTAIISAIAGGVGTIATVVATSSIDIINVKKHNKEIREELKRANFDNATKQKLIIQLNADLEKVTAALSEERNKSNSSDEKIANMEMQLADILLTIKAAKAA